MKAEEASKRGRLSLCEPPLSLERTKLKTICEETDEHFSNLDQVNEDAQHNNLRKFSSKQKKIIKQTKEASESDERDSFSIN